MLRSTHVPMVATRRTSADPPAPANTGWTFLTNHAHVLLRIARDPRVLVRTLAEDVGIRERAVLRIIAELESEGYLAHTREGRQNVYAVTLDKPLRHPIEMHKTVDSLIDVVVDGSSPTLTSTKAAIARKA